MCDKIVVFVWGLFLLLVSHGQSAPITTTTVEASLIIDTHVNVIRISEDTEENVCLCLFVYHGNL